MVLADLSARLGNALRKLNAAMVLDEEVVEQCLKEIAAALLQADVSVRLVSEMRKSVKKAVSSEAALSTILS